MLAPLVVVLSINVVVTGAMMTVLVYGSYLVTRNRMSIGGMVSFMGYLGQLMWPTTALGWVISIYQRGRAAMKRLEDPDRALATRSASAAAGGVFSPSAAVHRARPVPAVI